MTRSQVFKYLAVLLLGCCLTLFIFFSINNRSQVRNRTIIDNAVARSELKLEDELNKINLVMESMGFFFEHSPNISQKVFKRFTAPFLIELNGIRALEWAPKVGDSEITNNENLPLITVTDSANNLVAIKVKDIHFPIQLINPFNPLQEALGYDIYSDSTRRVAVDRAIDTKKVVLTGPIELILQNNGVPGWLAIKAVSDPSTENVKGIVAGVYRMDKFIGKTLNSELKVLDVCIHDDTANNQLMFSSLPENIDSLSFGKNTITQSIAAGDRTWNIHFVPKVEYLSFPHVFESYVVLIMGLAMTIFLTYFTRRRDGHNDRLESRVLLRTAELEESNRMKENLLREIHHRVKNNLQITSSLMNMQKRKLTSTEAIMALSDSQARISAIALTHQKIYQDKDSKAVNLHDYLIDLMEYQKKISSSFSYKINCPDISIDLDRAVPLALIISELVTNAVKHAYPDTTKYNELLINVARLDTHEVLLSILDNGKGLPDNFDIVKAEGIGFEIIRALCRQISAKLTYESNNYGTQFDLIFENKT